MATEALAAATFCTGLIFTKLPQMAQQFLEQFITEHLQVLFQLAQPKVPTYTTHLFLPTLSLLLIVASK